MRVEDIKIEPKWRESKEEIWAEAFESLKEHEREVTQPKKRPFALYMSVAAVVLMVILPMAAFLYSEDIVVPKGEHHALTFADGSKAIINADTKLSYKPFWWRISREVKLTGEAYFEVERGQKFVVYSNSDRVTVLGTSFNIFARGSNYNVSCLSGKVEVESRKESVILTEGMQSSLERGRLLTTESEEIEQSIGWVENRFTFNQTPLREVVKEIERQYNIEIMVPEKIDYIYSGNFSKLDDPEEVLHIIQEPFGIKLKIKR